jgi:riboflavin synthase
MFTGIIEEIGVIGRIVPIPGGRRYSIDAVRILEDLAVDQSVALNGVCLTTVELRQGGFVAEAVGETLEKSTLAHLQTGAYVNLERAMRLSDRLGGHLVQGHVNGVGRISRLQQRGDNWYLEVEVPENLSRYIISEGSIALDGISLTVADMENDRVGVSVIPHTYANTILKYRKAGDKLNIETDFIARYIEKFILGKEKSETISEDWLKRMGY